MIFISHANPEDNDFTMWLALQLAKEGYPVWCDLTKLLGGEDFWKEAEAAIRERTCKFIYVLSRSSNQKAGPRRELQIAENIRKKFDLQRFIIPVTVDDLPPNEFNIMLANINAISFNKSWATGIKTLLKNLCEEKVSKKDNFGYDAVAYWWNTQKSGKGIIIDEPEELISNWFPVVELPKLIYGHNLTNESKDAIHSEYPVVLRKKLIFSFGAKEELKQSIPSFLFGKNTFCIETEQFLEKDQIVEGIYHREATNLVSELLRIGWENMMRKRGFREYILSDKASAFGFTKDLTKGDDRIQLDLGGTHIDRAVIGYKSRRMEGKVVGKRFWHFAIGAKPLLYPIRGYIIRSHVLFSDDGNQFWESKEKMHSARRSQCRDWWNDDWRDRLLVTMAYLSEKDGFINIELGKKISLKIARSPINLKSPVSYLDPGQIKDIEPEPTQEDIPDDDILERTDDEK